MSVLRLSHANQLVANPHRRPGAFGRRQRIAALGFLAPGLILFTVFSVFPAVFSFVMAFMNWNGLSSPSWVGLGNYRNLLRDPQFGRSLTNTLLYTLEFVVLTTVCSLAVSAMLNAKFRGVRVVRFFWFLPFVTDIISTSLVWGWLYHPDFGILNYALSLIGIPGQSWLGDQRWALIALVVLSVWRWTGYYAVILVAAFQSVPVELEEAAQLDGASPGQIFRHIRVPLISPALFFVVTLEVMASLQVFEQMWVLTRGGPNSATISIAMYLYVQGFSFLRLGYASAVAWVLFILIFIITWLNWSLRKFWTFEG